MASLLRTSLCLGAVLTTSAFRSVGTAASHAPAARHAPPVVSAERGDDESGWSTRPLVPELQQPSSPTPKSQRVPWDWQRFVKQSAEFIELPSLLPTGQRRRQLAAGDSFGALQLFPLDDVVMGGASSSTFDNGSRTWAGEVTTQNSGGFVGVRSKAFSPPLDCSAGTGVELRVRPGGGSPLRYKFVIRDSTDFNGICWTASFDVGMNQGSLLGGIRTVIDGGVETVRIPFAALVPTIFARTVPDASIELSRVCSVQFALSKFEYDGGLSPLFKEGRFSIDLLDVALY